MVSFVFFVLGCLIGWLVAHVYYLRAGKQLANEAAGLRRLSTLVLRGLEEAGLVKWCRSDAGEITGITLNLKATEGAVTVTGHNAVIDHGRRE